MPITILDEDRRITYTPSSPTTAFPVPFPIFDLTDVAVLVAAVELLAADYTVTGTLIDTAYSDAIVTLDTAVQAVDVLIVGRRSPRREDQFVEGNRVPARDLNTGFNRLTAITRELFDRIMLIDPILENAEELVAQAVAAADLAEGFSRRTIFTVAGTSHTFTLTNINAVVDCQSASATILTIPPIASVVWTIGDQIDLRRGGTGLVTIAAGSGVTINSPNAYVTLPTRYGMATLIYMGANVWQLTGGLG